jgi:tetratricopeptide (TPR) repeat protein
MNSKVLVELFTPSRVMRCAATPAWRLKVAGLVALLALTATASARAQETAEEAKAMADALFENRFQINDENPEAHVPSEADRNANPVEFGFFLMNLGIKADDAEKHGDHASAAKYYRAMVAAVPDRSAGFTKLCTAYEALGQRAQAEAVCGAALLRAGVTLDDYAHYVRLVVAQREALTDKQIRHVDEVVAHLRKQNPEVAMVAELQCQLGLRLKDPKRLAACTTQLQKLQPNDMKTITYSWLLAVMRLDRKAAWSLVDRAKRTGAPPDTLRTMEQATSGLRSPLEQTLRKAAPVGGAVLLLVLVAALAWRQRRMTQRFTPGVLRKSNT